MQASTHAGQHTYLNSISYLNLLEVQIHCYRALRLMTRSSSSQQRFWVGATISVIVDTFPESLSSFWSRCAESIPYSSIRQVESYRSILPSTSSNLGIFAGLNGSSTLRQLTSASRLNSNYRLSPPYLP